jgi:N utilization substance protein B
LASNRHLSRIIALQSLFEIAFGDFNLEVKRTKSDKLKKIEKIVGRNVGEFSSGEQNKQFATAIAKGVIEAEKKIDAIIAPSAPEWPIEQIALVDLTILRMAVYELLFSGEEVPPKVAINEAVELAKAFGGPRSSKFVNGVLGTIYRASDRYNPEDDKRKQEEKAQKPSSKEESKKPVTEKKEKQK